MSYLESAAEGKKPKIDEGQRAVDFINNLYHTGRYRGEPFKLRTWQERIVRQLFKTNSKGKRQFTQSYISFARSNGKTELLAAILLYVLVGSQKVGQEIYSCSSTRKMASRLFDVAAQMIEQDDFLKEILTVRTSTRRIAYLAKSSFFCALDGEGKSNHSYKPTFVVFDELHTMVNRRLWDAMTTGNEGIADSFIVSITTAGDDKNSLCYQQYEYACKVRDKIIEDPKYLAIIHEVNSETDNWKDKRCWGKANPALGDFVHLEKLEEAFQKATVMPTEEKKFKQLNLNIWQDSDGVRWLNMKAWDDCKRPLNLEALKGKKCFGGLDLASTRDVTAFVLYFPEEGFLLPYFWLPKENSQTRAEQDRVPYPQWANEKLIKLTEGDRVDYNVVRNDINELRKDFNIVKILSDQHNATQLCQQLITDGFTIQWFIQGSLSFNGPSKEFERRIHAQEIYHDGNKVLRWMASNVVVITDDKENIIPSKTKSREKVDGIIAAIQSIVPTVYDSKYSKKVIHKRAFIEF